MRWRRELDCHLLPCGQAITALERAAAVVRPNQRDSSDRAPCSRGGEGGGGGRCRRRAAAAQRQRKGCGLRAPERRRSRGGAPQQRSSGAIDSETSPPPRRAAEPAQPSGPSGLHSAAHPPSFFFLSEAKREQTTYPLALEPKCVFTLGYVRKSYIHWKHTFIISCGRLELCSDTYRLPNPQGQVAAGSLIDRINTSRQRQRSQPCSREISQSQVSFHSVCRSSRRRRIIVSPSAPRPVFELLGLGGNLV